MMNFQELADQYKSELLDSVLPFWLEHSQDEQYGGYFTCLDRDGSVYDTDKFIWLQGREVWMFSMLYNQVEQRKEWLDCAVQGGEFLRKYGHDGDYNWYFSLTREGRPLVAPYNIFSYTFATMAFAQLAIASGDTGYAAIAKKTFDRVLEKRSNPKGKWCKAHPGTRPIKDFALPMILCNLSLEIEQLIDKQLIDETIETCLHEVMEVFYQKDLGLIVENVSAADNSLVDSFEGRSINPGHSLEAMWFIMDLGKRLNRPELIDKAVELANSALGMNLMANNFTVQNDIINAVKSSPDVFSSVFSADQIASISDFNFMFLGIDLSRVPHFAFDAASLMLMIIPILSVVTMILSQIITMKMSGQEMQGAMKWMPWIMSLMFVYFGFTVPVGFSLYYTASNVVMLVQSIILKKMYDPEEMKKQVQAEIEAKRAEKKKKKQVKVTTDDGREQVKEVSEAELARIRLARARELDEERYKDE